MGLALTLAGLGEFLWLRREQPGRILDFQPVAPSRVLIARRDIHPDVPEVYLELDEAQKGVVWRRRLPPRAHLPRRLERAAERRRDRRRPRRPDRAKRG